MKKNFTLKKPLNNERGVSIVLVAILSTVLIGFAALAIDYGHLYVVRNELRDAADAGALAGARVLYLNDGTAVNPGANAIAQAAATANTSEKLAGSPAPVEVGSADVERGHWSFNDTDPLTGKKGVFTPNPSLTAVDIWNYTTQQLDTNTDFINAVRVTARRESSPSIISYFAGLFGSSQFGMQQKAVAWLGFSGPIPPHGVDQPIAICEESIRINGGPVSCNVGRMLSSGIGNTDHNTGGWTNFTQPCETANPPTISPFLCAQGNTQTISGQGVGTTGGTVENIFKGLYNCWRSAGLDTNGDGIPDQLWPLRLLVISCPGNNVSNCAKVKGVIKLNVVWINVANDPQYDNVPRIMNDWTCNAPNPGTKIDREACWNSFRDHFQLKTADGAPADYLQKSVYMLPSCDWEGPVGGPGGENFGVLAKQPRLVDWYNTYSMF
jgi:hypothetical protein